LCRSSSTTPPRGGSSSTTPPRAGSSSTTLTTPRVWVPRHVTRLVTRLVALVVVDYSTSRGSSSTTSTTPRVRVPRHVARIVTQLVVLLVVDYSTSRRHVVDYFASTARPGTSACRAARHAARRAARHRLLHLAQARRRLLRLRRVSGYLGTSRDSSRGSSRRSSSTSPPRTGSSSTTSPSPCIRVPRHVARLVTRLVAPLVVDYSASRRLVVDYSASRRLVVDYFASAARPGASARHEARHVDHRGACRLPSITSPTSRGSLRRSSLTTSPTPRDWVPRHVARLIACRRLLRLRRATGCLGTSRGSLRRLSLTTSPTPRVRVPRHVARHVTRLLVGYSVRRDFILRPRWLYFSHAVRRDY
jgi:hypothetical protein